MLISPRYKAFAMKKYGRWTLYLHEKQWPFVGRCYAWWDDKTPREGEGIGPHEIPICALAEVMQVIFSDVLVACKALGHETGEYGRGFLLNTCYLANHPEHRHHLHVHYIPRFKNPLRVAGLDDVCCYDLAWGDNYTAPVHRDVELAATLARPESLQAIRASMARAIDGIV